MAGDQSAIVSVLNDPLSSRVLSRDTNNDDPNTAVVDVC